MVEDVSEPVNPVCIRDMRQFLGLAHFDVFRLS
jgi:hypothetical protein